MSTPNDGARKRGRRFRLNLQEQQELKSDYDRGEATVDEFIDLALNYRQSGHPGGSRSKVHLLLALMLSGGMRWDVLRPWRPFGDGVCPAMSVDVR